MQEYDVWYSDPEVVTRNMLVNPDFDNEFDITPFVELDKNGTCQRSDFMSGFFLAPMCKFIHFFVVLSNLTQFDSLGYYI